jgi:replicative DNA helicase
VTRSGWTKASPETCSAAPKAITDIFGSTWLTNGCGSVILLTGEPGDPITGFRHAKQPVEEVGPWQLVYDPVAGALTVESETSLVDRVRAKGVDGLMARDAAVALFETAKPTKAQKEKGRRRLVKLEAEGVLVCVEHEGASAWFLAERRGTSRGYGRYEPVTNLQATWGWWA